MIFSFDDNAGATRTGTLTIAGQTVTITQAGAVFVAANPVGTLVSSNLSNPTGIAVDGAGNVYIADTFNNAIKKWSPASQTMSTLVASNLINPRYVAVDPAGNVYFSAPSSLGIYKLSAASNTLSLYASGIGPVNGLAVDNAEIVYFDLENGAAVYKWTPPSGPKTTLVSGLYNPSGVALDRAGNLYIADTFNHLIKKWNAADHAVSNLVSAGLEFPDGVAVDGAGNVYFNDGSSNLLQVMPQAWVDNSAHSISSLGGTAAFSLVLPTTVFLGGAFAPYAEDAWLVVTGASNGAVHLAFSAGIRSTEFNILGQSFPVVQLPPFALTNEVRLNDGQLQFSFFCSLGNHFTILATSDPALPVDQWDVIAAFYRGASPSFQFTDPQATNNARRFCALTGRRLNLVR